MAKLSALTLLALTAGTFSVAAQSRVVAYVPTAEATASDVLAVSGGKNLLGGASVVTALDRPAHVTLARGGALLVCQTSVVHLTAAQTALQSNEKPDAKHEALLLSLDRGAVEIRISLAPGDAIMTPDLRFASADVHGKSAPLDLALRVTPNGDTCVENRGKKSPLLNITDSFGESAYQLKSGQHVLFEHGSLKEVVDRETSPCGCPSPTEGMSLAEAAVRGGAGAKSTPAYPFPAAVSEGLAPPAPLPPDKPGEVHTQVAGSLSYDPAETDTAPPTAASTPAAVPPTQAPAPPAPEPQHGIFHSVGSFFKRIFAR